MTWHAQKKVEQLETEIEQLREAAERAVAKAKREYALLVPDAEPGECWAEIEALEAALAPKRVTDDD